MHSCFPLGLSQHDQSLAAHSARPYRVPPSMVPDFTTFGRLHVLAVSGCQEIPLAFPRQPIDARSSRGKPTKALDMQGRRHRGSKTNKSRCTHEALVFVRMAHLSWQPQCGSAVFPPTTSPRYEIVFVDTYLEPPRGREATNSRRPVEMLLDRAARRASRRAGHLNHAAFWIHMSRKGTLHCKREDATLPQASYYGSASVMLYAHTSAEDVHKVHTDGM